MKLRKVRVEKGGREIVCECPRCPKLRKKDARLYVNPEKGTAYCFRCGYTFSVKLTAAQRRKAQQSWPDYPKDKPEVGPVPDNLYRVFVDRGIDPIYTISRYRIGWDGYRLCWPIGEGRYLRRAIYPWDSPKVIMDQPGGHDFVGGEHLMETNKYIVLTEGDWKAASIPLPWIGVLIGGTRLHETQLAIIRYHKPALVVVALDGGYETEGRKIITQLSRKLVPAVQWVGLPHNQGPDDIPNAERVKALIKVSKEVKC